MFLAQSYGKIDFSQRCEATLNISRIVNHKSCQKNNVMFQPIPNLIEECAETSSLPIALKTYDGSREADVQADPEETAKLLSA